MQAILLEQPRQFRLVDVPEPAAPAAGEAVVRVRAVGICGTDYGGYLGKMPFFSYPRIPGHELGVEVVAVGPGVTNVRPGDRCCVEPYINCQECFSCRRGLSNCCERHQTLGVHCDGGLRPLFTVPARKLHLSPRLTPAQNALVETLAIGCHAVDRSAAAAGETVLVIGAGPIGLSVVEFARLAGARVIVMDVAASRLRFVTERLGVTDTILARGGEADEAGGGGGPAGGGGGGGGGGPRRGGCARSWSMPREARRAWATRCGSAASAAGSCTSASRRPRSLFRMRR
jgi:alcohol dehydrogenase